MPTGLIKPALAQKRLFYGDISLSAIDATHKAPMAFWPR
jgi:hypothetical protein